MGKRFAIVIGVAALGVMALGAQTAAAAPHVHKYDTQVTSGPTGSLNDFNFTDVPVASVNAGTLAGFDTAVLNVASTGIALAPQQATNPVGTRHTLTATVTSQGNPSPNVDVIFFFNIDGANPGAIRAGTCSPASCRTGANGQVTFTYTGTRSGDDQFRACFTPQGGDLVCSAPATKTWTGEPPPSGAVWEAGHTDPASGCTAKVQSPYLEANRQLTAYTKIFCPRETRLTVRSRLRSDHRFDRPLFRNITVAQQGCLAASCVVDQPAGTRLYKLYCPRSSSSTLNQKYFTDIIIYAGTSPPASSPFPQRSRPSTLSPDCPS